MNTTTHNADSMPRLVRPTPRFWISTTTTDGTTYLAGFDGQQTQAVEIVVLGPDCDIESQWPNDSSAAAGAR